MLTEQPLAWFAADLLALGIGLMTLVHLVRQRQEPGAAYLAWMSGAVSLWAVLDLWLVGVGEPQTALTLARVLFLPQAIVILAWFGFSLSYTGQEGKLRGSLALLAGSVGILTILLLLAGDPGQWLVQGTLPGGEGAAALRLDYGPWRPIHDVWSWAMVIFSTSVLALHMAQSPRHVNRLAYVLGGPLVALLAYLLSGGAWGSPVWVNLAPLGMSMAAAALGWGLLRVGEREVAPVARNVVVEEMEDAVVVLDRKGRIVDVNRSTRERLGLRLLGPVPVALGATWRSVRQRMGESEMPVSERVDLPLVGGQMHTFEVRVTQLGPQAGRDRHVLVLRDITRQVQMERELSEAKASLEKLVNVDELTSLANRRHLLQRLREEVDRAHRYQRPLSLVLLDLDHFKRVNDTYGHAAGDDVLRVCARSMEGVCRDLDLAGRMGGEEFAILLPETDTEGARSLADRLRVEIARCLHQAANGEPFRVTASLGVATLEPGADVDVEVLMQAADEALYRAKDEGRNRVALSV